MWKPVVHYEALNSYFYHWGWALINYHSKGPITFVEDVADRAMPSLGLSHTPGPNILLKIQCFMFHFRQFENKQNMSKDIRIIFKQSNETVKDRILIRWSWFMFADCPFKKDGFFKQTTIYGYVCNFHFHRKVLNYENVSTVNHAFCKEWGVYIAWHLVPSIVMANRRGKTGSSDILFSWAPKSLQMVTATMKLKDACSLEEKLW